MNNHWAEIVVPESMYDSLVYNFEQPLPEGGLVLSKQADNGNHIFYLSPVAYKVLKKHISFIPVFFTDQPKSELEFICGDKKCY